MTAIGAPGHICAPGGFTLLELGGSGDELRSWIGEVDVPLRFAAGDARLVAVGFAGKRGEIVTS